MRRDPQHNRFHSRLSDPGPLYMGRLTAGPIVRISLTPRHIVHGPCALVNCAILDWGSRCWSWTQRFCLSLEITCAVHSLRGTDKRILRLPITRFQFRSASPRRRHMSQDAILLPTGLILIDSNELGIAYEHHLTYERRVYETGTLCHPPGRDADTL